MLERKSLAPYDEMKAEIYDNLKRQGIEEISAEKKIQKMIAASNGVLTREMIMDSLIQANVAGNPELKYLIQEYYDGLLLYEVSKNQVWDKAAENEAGLEAWYKGNKAKYAWSEPRFKGFVIYAKDKKSLKKAKKIVKKNQNGDWKSLVKKEINKDKILVRVVGPLLCKQGENNRVDELVFGAKKTAVNKEYPKMTVVGEKLKQPKSYKDVKSLVLVDYQESLEKDWVKRLREQFSFEINESVLSTVNNH
jgi:peptidyl-prolyl cis-trans isomerase SurA